METVSTVVGNVAKRTNSVLTAPLIANVDTVHLFLSIGVVMVAVIIWSRILAHIKG